jgi:thioredoxin 1
MFRGERMGNVLEINADRWSREVLESNALTLVDFWHKKCQWCLKLNPIIDEIAKEYERKIKFVKLDVLEKDNTKIAVNYGVMSTPTLIFFCKGKPVGQIMGFLPKEELREKLNYMLKKYGNCAK